MVSAIEETFTALTLSLFVCVLRIIEISVPASRTFSIALLSATSLISSAFVRAMAIQLVL